MSNSHNKSRQHGLTLFQWGILFAAFMVGLGGSFAVREIFPPSTVHASVIQTVPINAEVSAENQ